MSTPQPLLSNRPRALLALAVAALLCAVPAGTQEQDAALVLTGALVVDPASDLPVRDAFLVIRNGEIETIASGDTAPPPGAEVIDLDGKAVLPGFVDAHVHLSSTDAARRALEAGVTTARSMGVGFFADVGLRELSAAGRITAPEILAAGYHVRPSPAEGLFLDVPYLADLMGGGVRGEEAMRRVARAMLERGVDFIKTTATERAGLPDTDPRRQLYDEAELTALVEEAATASVPVAAHAHGDEGGRAAVLAGVRSIEHGTYLSEETLRLMAERGTWLVPTIAIVRDVAEPGGDYDVPPLIVRGRHMLPRVRETAARALELGVRIAAATDTGYSPDSVIRMQDEIDELIGIGMSPLEAIRAATMGSAELLGVADHAGRVAEGWDADLVVVERNPLEDPRTLHDVLMVIVDGEVVVDRLSFSLDPRRRP